MIHESLYSSRSEEWGTPLSFFEKLNEEFNFTLDACASKENKKVNNFFSKEQDALSQDWGSSVVYMNPPYGRNIGDWMRKAYESSLEGATVVALVHSRTDTRWFHNWVYGKAELRFIRGRLKFGDGKKDAPFPSLIAIYRPNERLGGVVKK